MQFMEQRRYILTPTMGFPLSGATIGKTLFLLVVALCILIELTGGQDNSTTELLLNHGEGLQEDTRPLPNMGTLFQFTPYSARWSIPGIPAPTGERPLDTLSSASAVLSGRSIDREVTFGTNGIKIPSLKSSTDAAQSICQKLNFSGRVVDSGGKPVVDAEIIYSLNFNLSENLSRSKSAARTGTDGTFNFELTHLGSPGCRRIDIIATHPNHAFGWSNLLPLSTADVEIKLETPGVISGRIANEDGAPIQNAVAQIQVLFSGDSAPLGHESSLAMEAIPNSSATTNANGEFVFRGLPKGATANLNIQGRGYAKEIYARVPVGMEGLKLRLKREARIEGHLSYAETGAPVKSATVALAGVYPTERGELAIVDANGNYVLENLPPGVYNLYLEKGPDGWTAGANAFIKLVEGQTVSNINLTLVRGGFVTGQVTDRDTNEPIAYHEVSLYDAARPEIERISHIAETDKSGTYRFRAAPGQALVYASAPKWYRDVGQVRKDVDIIEGESVVVDFQFSRGVKLAGRVLTEVGEPVAGAQITGISDRTEGFKEYGRSDNLGKFTVHGLHIGQKLSLEAEHTELRLRGTAEVNVPSSGLVEIKMKGYQQVKVSGRVVNRNGEPIPSAYINLMHWAPQIHMGIGTTVDVTDSDGRFKEVGLIVGDEYAISANADGYQDVETERFTATVEMNQIGNLTMLPVESRFFIEGRIIDTSGKPVKGARVVCSHWETITDKNGDYRLEDLSMAVVIDLRIYHPEYPIHVFRILKTNRCHDLVLVKADGYLAGKVMDGNGKPIDRAAVTIRPQEHAASGVFYSNIKTNEQGEFELNYIKDPIVSLHITNGHDYRVFENINVNQRELILTLTPTEQRPGPTPEWLAEMTYAEKAEERFKTLAGKPAPEFAVAEWLSGLPVSVGDLKGKTIALLFWNVKDSNRVQWARLLNLLQEVYGEKGIVCVAICSAKTEVEAVKQYIAEHSFAYSIGLDSPTDVIGARGETSDRYAVGWGAPIVLINGAGEITGRVWDRELEDRIQTLLAD